MDALASRAVLHTMRYKTATLAVLTLLAVMAGGASAASMTQPPASSAADVEQPANYTVGYRTAGQLHSRNDRS